MFYPSLAPVWEPARELFCVTFVVLQLKVLPSCISVLEMDFLGGKGHVLCPKIKPGACSRWAGSVKHHVRSSGRNHIPGWLHCSDPGSSSGHWAEGNAAALGPVVLHGLHGKGEVKNVGPGWNKSELLGKHESGCWCPQQPLPLVQCKRLMQQKGWI